MRIKTDGSRRVVHNPNPQKPSGFHPAYPGSVSLSENDGVAALKMIGLRKGVEIL